MFCVKCGVKNPDDSNFCHKCGHNFSNNATTNLSNNEEKQKTAFLLNFRNAYLELMESEKNGIWENAINATDKLLALNITNNTINSYFLTAKGMYLFNLKLYDSSLQCLDKAIELKATNALAWYYKGCNYNFFSNSSGLKYEAFQNAKKLGIDDRNIDNWWNTYTGQEIQKAFKELDNEYSSSIKNLNTLNTSNNTIKCSECLEENNYNSKSCKKCTYIFGTRENGKATFENQKNQPLSQTDSNTIDITPKTEKGKELLQKLKKQKK